MSGPEEAMAVVLYIVLAIIAATGLVVGLVAFWWTGNGIAGLAAMLAVCAVGLALLRFA